MPLGVPAQPHEGGTRTSPDGRTHLGRGVAGRRRRCHAGGVSSHPSDDLPVWPGGAPLPWEAVDVPVALPVTGALLVAAPLIDEPTFARTVVLLLDHDEDGTLGVVLNRSTDIDVGAILPGWRVHVTGEPLLFDGGPVARDSALGLASVPGPEAFEPDGFRRVTGALGLIDLDMEPASLVDELAGLRIFAGYAGWSPGQLEDEIDEGAWYVVPAESSDVFTAEPAALWRTVLRRQPGELAFLATFPDDPSLN